MRGISRDNNIRGTVNSSKHPSTTHMFMRRRRCNSRSYRKSRQGRTSISSTRRRKNNSRNGPSTHMFFRSQMRVATRGGFLRRENNSNNTRTSGHSRKGITKVPRRKGGKLFNQNINNIFGPLRRTHFIRRRVSNRRGRVACHQDMRRSFRKVFFRSRHLRPTHVRRTRRRSRNRGRVRTNSIRGLMTIRLRINYTKQDKDPQEHNYHRRNPRTGMGRSSTTRNSIRRIRVTCKGTPFRQVPNVEHVVPTRCICHRNRRRSNGRSKERRNGRLIHWFVRKVNVYKVNHPSEMPHQGGDSYLFDKGAIVFRRGVDCLPSFHGGGRGRER